MSIIVEIEYLCELQLVMIPISAESLTTTPPVLLLETAIRLVPPPLPPPADRARSLRCERGVSSLQSVETFKSVHIFFSQLFVKGHCTNYYICK